MARRRLNLSGTIDPSRHAATVERNLARITGSPRTAATGITEDPAPGPEKVSGAGGASTGFGRRSFETDYEDIVWNDDVPYPQVMPTRTTDMDRPRTVASGYDPSSRILRVTFREGATYEYLEVPPQTWDAFERTPSPGRMIDDVLNQFFYRRID